MRAYYNDHEPFACAWLRELIADGLIAEGDVDGRDVWDIKPDELRGYTQVHLFAGIGGWSRALRLAGWPDDRPVWTASTPCQPFSAAGNRGGMSDERHLWPAAFHLIEAVRPECVFGEQVASQDGLAWLDLVLADLDGAGYSAGAVDCCAAGVGAPHIRQRLWFVAESEHADGRAEQQASGAGERRCGPGGSGELGDTAVTGLAGRSSERGDYGGQLATAERAGVMADADAERRNGQRLHVRSGRPRQGAAEATGRSEAGSVVNAESELRQVREATGAGAGRPASGSFWSDCIWLPCRDGKSRPTKPGIQPLAHGVRNRVGTLRGAGNAIVPQVAAEVIRSYMEMRHA